VIIHTLYVVANIAKAGCKRQKLLLGVAAICFIVAFAIQPCQSAEDPRAASTSGEAKAKALRSLPYKNLAPIDRQKVDSVLKDLAAFRHLPVRVTSCDPELYDFMSSNPDVVVGIWRTLKLTQLQVKRLNENTFQIKEADGSLAMIQIIYKSPEQMLVYGEGMYSGSLMINPVRGRFLLSLRSSFLREVNDKYFVTANCDVFVRVESTAADLIVKTLHPLFGSVADNNFTQTIAFLGSLSKTAEMNCAGVQRLAMSLKDVPQTSRHKLIELAEKIGGQPKQTVARTQKPTLRYVSESSTIPPADSNQPMPAWNVPRSLLPSGGVDPRGSATQSQSYPDRPSPQVPLSTSRPAPSYPAQTVPVPRPVIVDRQSGYSSRPLPTSYQ